MLEAVLLEKGRESHFRTGAAVTGAQEVLAMVVVAVAQTVIPAARRQVAPLVPRWSRLRPTGFPASHLPLILTSRFGFRTYLYSRLDKSAFESGLLSDQGPSRVRLENPLPKYTRGVSVWLVPMRQRLEL